MTFDEWVSARAPSARTPAKSGGGKGLSFQQWAAVRETPEYEAARQQARQAMGQYVNNYVNGDIGLLDQAAEDYNAAKDFQKQISGLGAEAGAQIGRLDQAAEQKQTLRSRRQRH